MGCKIAEETWNNTNFKLGNRCCLPKEFLDVIWFKENPEIGTELRLKVKGKILLLIVCSSSNLRLYCLTVNGYLFIYLCFLCVHQDIDKIILFKIF